MLSVTLRQSAPIPLEAEFTCDRGELVALVGPSGSGKTTILRAVAGLAHVSEGTVRVGNITWTSTRDKIWLTPQERRVGFVFQNYALFPHLSALENVALASSHSDAERHARQLLERVRLSGAASRRPARLSGGEQQRVALARALAREPALLLLDEPFSAVDQVTRRELFAELLELHRDIPIPIVLVTHDLDEARVLADRIVVVDDGTTVQTGEPDEVLARPVSSRVADLLGVRNHFKGVFRRTASGGLLQWLPESNPGNAAAEEVVATIEIHDKGRISDGERVSWTVSGEHIRFAPGAEHTPGMLHASVETLIPLGEVTECRLRVGGEDGPLLLLMYASSEVRRLGIVGGTPGSLTLDGSAVHVMPVYRGG